MILSVAGVRFSYRSGPVLRDIHFRLPAGRTLGLLGVNGAGKTTLLKCINRVLRPSGGAVMVDGRDVLGMKRGEVARLMGYVPQYHGEERLTVFDTVLLGRKPHMGWSATRRDYRVVEGVLRRMSLEDLSFRPVRELSGGETQKVMIARALAQEPAVLLLDEPTSNLDLRNQLEVLRLVTGVVKEQGISAVVSVHDLTMAFRLADHFLLLKNGRVNGVADRETLTSEMIREVYGVEVILGQVEGYTVVIPIDGDDNEQKRFPPAVGDPAGGTYSDVSSAASGPRNGPDHGHGRPFGVGPGKT